MTPKMPQIGKHQSNCKNQSVEGIFDDDQNFDNSPATSTTLYMDKNCLQSSLPYA